MLLIHAMTLTRIPMRSIFGNDEFFIICEEEGAREARELEHKAEVMDTWGSRPDPRFGKGNPILPVAEPVHG